MKKLLLLILLLGTCFVHGQEQRIPDYKAIKKAIGDKRGGFYYPQLWNRFLKGDSTFTLEEKQHLYYGYVFQDAYNPMSATDYRDSLNSVLEKKTLGEADYVMLLAYAQKALKEEPFYLGYYNYILFAADKLENDSMYTVAIWQARTIVDAIAASGDGMAKETAIYVIAVSHEYSIINILGFEFGGSQSTYDQRYDYLKVRENEFGVEGLYFDVSPSFEYLAKMFKTD